jgi:hypothetical protein
MQSRAIFLIASPIQALPQFLLIKIAWERWSNDRPEMIVILLNF